MADAKFINFNSDHEVGRRIEDSLRDTLLPHSKAERKKSNLPIESPFFGRAEPLNEFSDQPVEEEIYETSIDGKLSKKEVSESAEWK